MKVHEVRTYRSAEELPREDQLAWKMAAVATDPVAVEADVEEMIARGEIDDMKTVCGLALLRARRRG